MPFEPRIYNKDDGGGANRADDDAVRNDPVWNDAEMLDLPDDLAALAEQLRDDAVYLAERHPADATHEQREQAWQDYVACESPARHSSQPWKWMSAAAALAALFAVGGWAVYVSSSAAPDVPTIVATETPAHTIPNKRNATRAAVGNPLGTAAVSEPFNELPRLVPATFLQDVSGPELDGMLDLLEEDESGLSI